MADGHRLCALKMGVAGHRGLRLGLGAVESSRCQSGDPGAGLSAGVLDVETERGRDLIVA